VHPFHHVGPNGERDDIYQISYSTFNHLAKFHGPGFQRPAFGPGEEMLDGVKAFKRLQVKYDLCRMIDG
jgi:hypothetical protein